MPELYEIEGKRGSGKSLIAVILAFFGRFEKDIYLNFPNSIPNSKNLDLANFIMGNIKKGYLFFDESYQLLDSRHSPSHINLGMSYELFQIRKDGIDLFVITQERKTLDLRFRNQIDCSIQCERVPNDLNIQPEFFKYRFIRENSISEFILDFENAKQFFQYYDTNQRIVSENVTDMQLKLIKQTNPYQFHLLSEKVARKLYEKTKGENLTHDEIILELQNMNESALYEKNCWLLCKKWQKEKLEKKKGKKNESR